MASAPGDCVVTRERDGSHRLLQADSVIWVERSLLEQAERDGALSGGVLDVVGLARYRIGERVDGGRCYLATRVDDPAPDRLGCAHLAIAALWGALRGLDDGYCTDEEALELVDGPGAEEARREVLVALELAPQLRRAATEATARAAVASD